MEQIIDFNIYNYSIYEIENLCDLSRNYSFKEISNKAILKKEFIMQNFSLLDKEKKKDLDKFFENIISRLERNLLNKNMKKIIKNQCDIINILRMN